MFCELVLSAALFAAGQGRALPEIPLTRDAVLPSKVYLVKAHALAAAKGGKQSAIGSVPFEIDYVYIGPGDLKGKAFSATEIHTFVLNFSPIGWYEVTPIRKGEAGVWWVYAGKQGLASVYGTPLGTAPVSGPVWKAVPDVIFPPALKDGSKAGDAVYEMAATRAEVFEKVYHASDKDRLKVIDDYVRSYDSIKGAAALMMLLTGNNPIRISTDESLPLHERYRVDKFPKIAGYVLPFSKDDSLSPRVQWEVEQLLFLNKDGWKGSPEERRMIKRWFAGAWKEKENVPWEASDEKALVELPCVAPPFFSAPPYTPSFTLVENLELATAGLANGARSDRFKAGLLQSLKRGLSNGTPRIRTPASLADAEKAFEFLVQAIRRDKSPDRQVAAAKLLTVFAPLSPQQRAIVHALPKAMLPPEAKEAIAKALAEK